MPGALIAGAATVGAGALGASAAKSGSKKAAEAARYAADQNRQVAAENRDLYLRYALPQVNAYSGVANALMQRVAPGGGGYAPTSGGSGGGGGGIDWDAYLAQNPDVMAWAQAGGGDPSLPVGAQSLQDRAAFHYQSSGRAEGRTVQQLPQTEGGGYNALLGVAPGGATSRFAGMYGADAAPEPMFKRGPDAPTLTGDEFKASPYYNLGVDRGVEAANQGFAARGVLRSGGAAKGIVDYARERQSENYGDWAGLELQRWDRKANQFNVDRAFERGIYERNRDYVSQRFDRNTSDLFQAAGLGQNALLGLGGALGDYTRAVTGANDSAASATGNAALMSAYSQNQLYGTLANAFGRIAGGANPSLFGSNALTSIPTVSAYDTYGAYSAGSPYAPNALFGAPSPRFG